jgi:hypothetical protein
MHCHRHMQDINVIDTNMHGYTCPDAHMPDAHTVPYMVTQMHTHTHTHTHTHEHIQMELHIDTHSPINGPTHFHTHTPTPSQTRPCAPGQGA